MRVFLKVFYIDLRKTEGRGARYLILLFILKMCDISYINEPQRMPSIYIPLLRQQLKLKNNVHECCCRPIIVDSEEVFILVVEALNWAKLPVDPI